MELLFLLTMSFMVNVMGAEDSKIPIGDKDNEHRILVISLDGFGHSYLGKYPMEHLSKIYRKGSTSEKFKNQFITKTFPNHFSVATGVYEEVHGVVANAMYDPMLKRNLKINDKGFFTQNPGVVPVWTLNEANGGHSGCIMWPGCGETYQGQNVTYWEPYKSKANLKESISLALQWFTDRKSPANLVFVYHEEPDYSGHAYGPNSSYIGAELKKIDEAIEFLFQSITLHNLQDITDIIILSDHGMSAIPDTNIINLDSIVDPKLYTFTGSSPVLNVWASPEHQLTVYKKLLEGSRTNNYSVYLKDEFPEPWHYKNNPRISSILLLADEGYVFQDFNLLIDNLKKKKFPGLTNVHGDHGYAINVSSMEPIFVALGPSFKHQFQAPPFTNLDIYPLLCHLMSLKPGPHNGTMTNISTILAVPITSSLIQPLLIALGCLIGLIGFIGVLACILSKRDLRGRRIPAESLINGYIHRKNLRGIASAADDDFEAEGLLESEVITVDL